MSVATGEHILQYFYVPTKEQLNGSVYMTWAGHRKCTPQHVIGPRVLDTYKIGFVVNGGGYMRQNGGECIELTEGDMFVLYPGVSHYYYANPESPWELMWVCFNGSICDYLLRCTGLSVEKFVGKNILTASLMGTLQAILTGLGNPADSYKLRATGHLYILFAQIQTALQRHIEKPAERNREDLAQRAVDFIEQNYYLHIDADILSNHVNYSKSHLSRTFHASVGMTIPEFIGKVRVQNSMYLLRETSLSMQEIARSVGIDDAFYFSKLFKKLTGVSPGGYKNKMRRLVETNLSGNAEKEGQANTKSNLDPLFTLGFTEHKGLF